MPSQVEDLTPNELLALYYNYIDTKNEAIELTRLTGWIAGQSFANAWSEKPKNYNDFFGIKKPKPKPNPEESAETEEKIKEAFAARGMVLQE